MKETTEVIIGVTIGIGVICFGFSGLWLDLFVWISNHIYEKKQQKRARRIKDDVEK